MKRLTAFLMSFLLCIPMLSAVADASDESAPPRVLPALRSWTGSAGVFPVGESTVISDGTNTGVGEKAARFFREMCGKNLTVTPSRVDKSAIRFELVKKLPSEIRNAEEGYLLTVTPAAAVVKAKTYVGLLYGAVTLVQMCYADGKGESIQCGSAADYPAFGTRTGLIDAARAWIPLDQLTQIAKYMAWFKLNEIHVHLSDNTGFRLESDVPGLSTVVNGEKRYYGKDEYRAFQKELLEYGIRVVSEIDTPAHSGPFANITSGGPAMIEGRFLDLSDEEYDRTLSFVKALWDEYLKGDDPVFVGKVVSIGTDEYLHDEQGTWNEPMRRYTADLGTYVHDLGYTPCNWAFLGPDGFPGETEIPTFIRADMWDNGISGLEKLVEGKYDIVNMLNARLYVVPGENKSGGFPDRMNIEGLYRSWQVWNFGGWGIEKAVPSDYSHLLGAGFALWNDYAGLNRGMTVQDIFDRIRDMTCLVAEKTWCGGDTENGDVDAFLDRVNVFGRRAGGADPGYHALDKDLAIDFSEPLPDGFSVSGTVEGDRLILDGGSFLSYDRKGVGFPNALTMDVCLTEIPDSPLLSGAGYAFYADADGRGHMGYTVEDNLFLFDCSFPVGREVTLTLSSGTGSTTLLVNGKNGYDAYNPKNVKDNRMETFVLPLETVGKGAKGYLRNLRISPSETDWSGLRLDRNLALGRPVTVSGTEVADNHLAPAAVDGSETTRLSFARDKDEQWMIVDLGAVYPIRSVEIQFFERVMSYDVFASEDGLTYRKIYGFRGETEDDKKTEHTAYLDAISVGEDVSARYVKYVQNKRWYHSGWSTYYSGGISEFRVYSIDREPYRQLALNAKAAAAKRGAGDLTRRKLALAAVELEEYLLGRHLYAGNLETIADRIADLTNGELTAGPRKGDVNGDGRVSAADCLAVKAQTLRGGAIPEDRLSAADADGDKKITAADADAIRKSALKQEPLC